MARSPWPIRPWRGCRTRRRRPERRAAAKGAEARMKADPNEFLPPAATPPPVSATPAAPARVVTQTPAPTPAVHPFPRPEIQFQRFTRLNRILHVVMIVSFISLATTGLTL